MNQFTTIFAIAIYSIFLVNTHTAYAQESNNKVTKFLWEENNGLYRTLDNFSLQTKTKATWIISDEEIFKSRLGDTKNAEWRLNDIIPPAIHTQFNSYRKSELYDSGAEQKYIKKVHTDEIIKLFDKVTSKFGIKVIGLKIETKGV